MLKSVYAGVAERQTRTVQGRMSFTLVEVQILPSALCTRGGIGIRDSLRSYALRGVGVRVSPSALTFVRAPVDARGVPSEVKYFAHESPRVHQVD